MEQKRIIELQIKNVFIKLLLKKGKKTISEKLFYKLLISLKQKTKQKPFFILLKIFEYLSPKLKLIGVPIGTRNKKKKKNVKKKYYLIFLNEESQLKVSINWILSFSKNKSSYFLENIKNEILDTFNKKSKSIEQKNLLYSEIKKMQYFLKIA